MTLSMNPERLQRLGRVVPVRRDQSFYGAFFGVRRQKEMTFTLQYYKKKTVEIQWNNSKQFFSEMSFDSKRKIALNKSW